MRWLHALTTYYAQYSWSYTCAELPHTLLRNCPFELNILWEYVIDCSLALKLMKESMQTCSKQFQLLFVRVMPSIARDCMRLHVSRQYMLLERCVCMKSFLHKQIYLSIINHWKCLVSANFACNFVLSPNAFTYLQSLSVSQV